MEYVMCISRNLRKKLRGDLRACPVMGVAPMISRDASDIRRSISARDI
jgi:hypothetical protein